MALVTRFRRRCSGCATRAPLNTTTDDLLDLGWVWVSGRYVDPFVAWTELACPTCNPVPYPAPVPRHGCDDCGVPFDEHSPGGTAEACDFVGEAPIVGRGGVAV